ncbi:SRPBCC family protein [Streptomyces sp. NPDC046925]|uniref:SRPBCC family protein n=1 Tax=Streptomyces sp. NPDC046925 TaxID=3155375 RepID=UPI0033CE7CD2
MALFRIDRTSPLPADEAWSRLTTWERHADVVPLTRVHVRTPPPGGEGTVFVARSGIGPVGFDDVMEVVTWRPAAEGGGMCRLEKRGSFVTGWAEIEVSRRAESGSAVVWREELSVRFLPRFLDGALTAAGRLMFGRAVDRLLASGPPRPHA